jgi:Tfp pilus assembly protein PilF
MRLNCRTGAELDLPHKIPEATVEANPVAASSPAPGELGSWKEIAVYLGREVRTVQRWERTDGLPVRRLKHAKRGSVFAYREELDRWVELRLQAPSGERAKAEKTQPLGLRNLAVIAVGCGVATLVFLSLHFAHSYDNSSAARRASETPARAAYQRGIYYLNRGKLEDLRESERYFKQAIAADANYAGAHARLAEIRLYLRGRSRYSLHEVAAALDEAERAVQLDPASGEAHEAVATVRAFGLWDWSGGEGEFRQALRLNPESGSAHNGYAELLALAGREEAAISEAERARQLEPLSALAGAGIPWYYYWARRYDEAIAFSRRILPSEPQFDTAQMCIVRSLVAQERWEEARAELIVQMKKDGEDPVKIGLTAAPPKEALRHYYEWDLAKREKQEAVGEGSNFLIGIDLAALHRKEELFDNIRKSFEDRESLPLVMNLEPLFDPFRNDPRFALMARETGLPVPGSPSAKSRN